MGSLLPASTCARGDNISDTGIMHLAMGSLRLSGLDVSFCDKVGTEPGLHRRGGLDGLKSLSHAPCHISDDGINRMVRQMHGLRTLNIGQCVRITDRPGADREHLEPTHRNVPACTAAPASQARLERITQLPLPQGTQWSGLWRMTDSEKVR